MEPLVSVVIPTYNRAHLLGETIASALAQSHHLLEVIVVDDGSTDDTEDLLIKIGDDRLRYFRQENSGVSSARNHGIRVARGELVAFLDSDDLWDADKLEHQVPLFENNNVGWAYCDYRHFGEPGAEDLGTRFSANPPVRGRMLKHMFVNRFPIQTSSLIARKRCLEEAGMFNESYAFAEDIDLYFRLAERFEVDYTDKVLTSFRHRPGGSVVPPLERLQRWVDLRTRVLQDNPELELELTHAELNEAYYRSVLKLSRLYLAAGRPSEARAYLRSILRFEPWSWKAWMVLALSFGPSAIRSRV